VDGTVGKQFSVKTRANRIAGWWNVVGFIFVLVFWPEGFSAFGQDVETITKQIPFHRGFDGEPLTFGFPDGRQYPPPHFGTWPEATPGGPPLRFNNHERHPFANPAGRVWVERINEWVAAGSAAGLSQDAFLSADMSKGKAHSKLDRRSFPGLTFLPPYRASGPFRSTASRDILRKRATMVVQSLGYGPGYFGRNRRAEADYGNLYDIRRGVGSTELSYRSFYFFNTLFAAPAIKKNGPGDIAFISPYYLLAKGSSGKDSHLLKPLAWASAALPPALKTRILREGLYVPTMMWLFKSSLTESGIRDPGAHRPFYGLPAEAYDDEAVASPFLDRLLNKAHDLESIPTVTRIEVLAHDAPWFYGDSVFGVVAALKKGQRLEMEFDLAKSWTVDAVPPGDFHAAVIYGEAELIPLNEGGSRWRLEAAWQPNPRIDVLLLADDGAPAYISVKCVQYDEVSWFNVDPVDGR